MHRILSEMDVKGRILFTDREDLTWIGLLEALGFGPCKGLVPTTIAIWEIQEDEVLCDYPTSDSPIQVSDLPNVAISWGIWCSGTYGGLPFGVLPYSEGVQHVDTSTIDRRLNALIYFNFKALQETVERAVTHTPLQLPTGNAFGPGLFADLPKLTQGDEFCFAHDLPFFIVFTTAPTWSEPTVNGFNVLFR